MTAHLPVGALDGAWQEPKPKSAADVLRDITEACDRLPKPERCFGFSDISFRRTIVPSLGAIRIVEDASMVETREDWSEVRSPSRAARRRRQGHRQRIRFITTPKPEIYSVGDMMVMHPETARRARQSIANRIEQAYDAAMVRALTGGLFR